MVTICSLLTALIALIIGITSAQRVVQDDWINPKLPDESVTITTGSTYTVQWTGQLYTWFAQYAPNANVSDVDLYITGTDNPDYQHLIQAGVNVRTARSIAWTVSLPMDELSDTPYFTFRFIKAGTTFTSTTAQQISSPQMIVRAGTGTTTTSAIVSSTSSATTSTATTSNTSGSAVSNTADQSAQTSPPSKLSAGAIAGIVVGVVVVVALVAGFVLFMVITRQRRTKKAQQDLDPMSAATQQSSPNSFKGYYSKSTAPSTSNDTMRPPLPSYRTYHVVAELPIVSSLERVQLP